MKLHKQNKNLIKHLIFNLIHFKRYLLTQKKNFKVFILKMLYNMIHFQHFMKCYFLSLKNCDISVVFNRTICRNNIVKIFQNILLFNIQHINVIKSKQNHRFTLIKSDVLLLQLNF